MKRLTSIFLNADQQRGLSLIELMVAMVIGLVLILGVTQIFINNQKSYLFQQGQVGNQENSRFALAVLSQELSKAGYRSQPAKTFSTSAGLGCTFADDASVVAVSATALCLRYQAANKTDVNCQGTALAAASQDTIISPYRQTNPVIVEKIEFDATSQSIICTSGATSLPLVTGVAGLRFEYGSGSGDNKEVSTFDVKPLAANIIGAVRYTVLMQSQGSASVRDTAAPSSALAEWNSRFGDKLADSNQIYQLVQGTTMIRNQMK